MAMNRISVNLDVGFPFIARRDQVPSTRVKNPPCLPCHMLHPGMCKQKATDVLLKASAGLCKAVRPWQVGTLLALEVGVSGGGVDRFYYVLCEPSEPGLAAIDVLARVPHFRQLPHPYGFCEFVVGKTALLRLMDFCAGSWAPALMIVWQLAGIIHRASRSLD